MANAKLGTKAVGSIVKLKVNGTATEFIVVHQGLPSSMYDSSCNGTWLLMKVIYEKRAWHRSNVNKYESSDIHAYLNSTFLNLFESNIRDGIKQVNIPYRKNGGSGGTTQQGANGLPCKIFLGLSQILCKHRNAVQIEQNLFKAEVAQAAAALFSK